MPVASPMLSLLLLPVALLGLDRRGAVVPGAGRPAVTRGACRRCGWLFSIAVLVGMCRRPRAPGAAGLRAGASAGAVVVAQPQALQRARRGRTMSRASSRGQVHGRSRRYAAQRAQFRLAQPDRLHAALGDAPLRPRAAAIHRHDHLLLDGPAHRPRAVLVRLRRRRACGVLGRDPPRAAARRSPRSAASSRSSSSASIAADERDIIRVRTNVRGEDDYLYRLRLPRADIRCAVPAYVEQTNELLRTPRFYNTITVNCTTLVYHMMRAHRRPAAVELPRAALGLPARVRLFGRRTGYAFFAGGAAHVRAYHDACEGGR